MLIGKANDKIQINSYVYGNKKKQADLIYITLYYVPTLFGRGRCCTHTQKLQHHFAFYCFSVNKLEKTHLTEIGKQSHVAERFL